MELMDRQLTDQDVRFAVYEWVSMTKDCSQNDLCPIIWNFNLIFRIFDKPVRLQGKFEQFLPSKQDYRQADLEPLAISVVAKRLAKLHGATIAGVDHSKHKANMWANTYLIEYHIRSVVSFMNEGNDFARKRLRAQISTGRCIFENQRDWFPIKLCNWYGEIFHKVSGQDVLSKFWLHGNYLKSSFGRKSCLSKSFIKDIMIRIPRKIEIDSFYAIGYVFLKTIISNH